MVSIGYQLNVWDPPYGGYKFVPTQPVLLGVHGLLCDGCHGGVISGLYGVLGQALVG